MLVELKNGSYLFLSMFETLDLPERLLLASSFKKTLNTGYKCIRIR